MYMPRCLRLLGELAQALQQVEPRTCSNSIHAPLQPAKTPGTLRKPAALALSSVSTARRATKPPATPRYLLFSSLL